MPPTLATAPHGATAPRHRGAGATTATPYHATPLFHATEPPYHGDGTTAPCHGTTARHHNTTTTTTPRRATASRNHAMPPTLATASQLHRGAGHTAPCHATPPHHATAPRHGATRHGATTPRHHALRHHGATPMPPRHHGIAALRWPWHHATAMPHSLRHAPMPHLVTPRHVAAPRRRRATPCHDAMLLWHNFVANSRGHRSQEKSCRLGHLGNWKTTLPYINSALLM